MSNFTATSNTNSDRQDGVESIFVKNDSRIVNECWSIASTGIAELLSVFFSQLDDDLFRLSEKAETNSRQELLFETMRLFRREREGMRTHYMNQMSTRYDEYWDKSSANLRLVAAKDKTDAGELSLIEEEVLEESLALNGMIEKGNAMHQSQLSALNKRFCALSGRESEVENNPVSPSVLCKQFALILKPMEVDLKIKLVIYKVFDYQILSKFGSCYQNLNAKLADNGILPAIANTLRKSNERSYKDEDDRPIAQSKEDDAIELSSYLETFRNMQTMMDTWRLQLGISSLSSAVGAAVVDSGEVINMMDVFQRSVSDGNPNGQPLSAEGLKQQLALQLGSAEGNRAGRTIGRPEEDIIDMVGMIFDFILGEKDIPPSIKWSIARLQIPIIKVAILDKTFFAKKNHPCRILLNDLAQAGIGLAATEVNSDNPIIQKVEEIVAKITNGFSQDIGLFDELLKDFTAFMEKEIKRSAISEVRTLQTTQSKEKVWLAKKAVATEITLRLQNVDAPAFFRTFIYNDWKDVLFLAYLRREKDDGEWERALAVLDKMIWSITPPTTSLERMNLIREIPVIVKAIRQGLESTSLDAHQIASLLKDLEVCHMNTLHPNASTFKTAEKTSHLKDAESILPTNDVEIKDAELAEAIMEIKSQLPDISNIDVEEVIMESTNHISHKDAPNWLVEFVKDKHTEAANHLKVGDWIGIVNEDSHVWRAKLAWKSPTTSTCVFVNRRGVKVLELRVNDLALRMRQGRVTLIEGASIPLMDRALSFLTQSLQNPFARTEQAPFFA